MNRLFPHRIVLTGNNNNNNNSNIIRYNLMHLWDLTLLLLKSLFSVPCLRNSDLNKQLRMKKKS